MSGMPPSIIIVSPEGFFTIKAFPPSTSMTQMSSVSAFWARTLGRARKRHNTAAKTLIDSSSEDKRYRESTLPDILLAVVDANAIGGDGEIPERQSRSRPGACRVRRGGLAAQAPA
jgi:hypothetical protein